MAMFARINKTVLASGALLLLFTCLVSAQDMSATATSVRGTVSATSDNGEVRNVSRGDQIYSGDLIETSTRSRIRMAFTDGGSYVLKENTSFEIDEYVFNGQEDGTEKATFQLLKGTVEALSGLIGKTNNDNFRLDTPLAAIGLRGTEFTVNVIQPENPGDPVRVQLSVIGGIVTYQTTISIPGAPPPQLLDVYQGNSIEQLENTLPQEISSIIVPLLTMTPEGEDVEEVIEQEFESETENTGEDSNDDSPGQSEDAPGQNDDALGQSGNTPGQGGDAPGQNVTNAPGQSANAPGQTQGGGNSGGGFNEDTACDLGASDNCQDNGNGNNGNGGSDVVSQSSTTSGADLL